MRICSCLSRVVAAGGLAVSLMAFGSGTIRAQNPRDGAIPTASIGTASIAGRVLLVVNNQPTPVRRARVTLTSDGGAASRTTDSDTEGHFRFDALPAGTYRMSADKPGFVPLQHAVDRTTVPLPSIALNAAQAVTTDIVMQRGAALDGQVVNENGNPVAGLVVSAFRLAYGPYGKRPVPVRQARTDDRGRFRVHTLAAGEYYVDAAPDPLQPSNAPTPPGQRPTAIARTYYPGSPRLEDARIVQLSVGQDATGLDFKLTSVPVANINGQVLDSSGKMPAAYSFRIQRVGTPPGEVRGFGSPPPDATFFYTAVPPGEYWLMASAISAPGADPEYSAMRITVGGQDMPNLTLATAKGATVAGRVESDGDGPLVPGGLQVIANPTEYELPPPQLGAPPPATAPAATVGGVVRADGTLAFPSLLGKQVFRLNRLPDGWALKSVVLDGVDVSDTPIDFQAADRPHTLRLIVTSHTGTVSGTVANPRGPVAARVVIFPEDSKRWGVRSRFIKTVDASADGKYEIGGLLPGKYFIAPVDYLEDGAWEDPDVLGRLQSIATSFAVTGIEKLTLALKLPASR